MGVGAWAGALDWVECYGLGWILGSNWMGCCSMRERERGEERGERIDKGKERRDESEKRGERK